MLPPSCVHRRGFSSLIHGLQPYNAARSTRQLSRLTTNDAYHFSSRLSLRCHCTRKMKQCRSEGRPTFTRRRYRRFTHSLFAESLDQAALANAESPHRNDFDSNTLPNRAQMKSTSSNRVRRSCRALTAVVTATTHPGTTSYSGVCVTTSSSFIYVPIAFSAGLLEHGMYRGHQLLCFSSSFHH